MENLRTPTLATRKKTILVLCFIFSSLLSAYSFAQPSITWQRMYFNNLPGDSYGNDICQTSNNSFVLAGMINNNSIARIIKINGLGDTIWTKIINNRTANSVIPDLKGGCVIAGSNYLTVLDSSGNIETDNQFTFESPNIYDIIMTPEGDYILVGIINSENAYIAKINPVGNLLWEKIYYSTFFKAFYSVTTGFDNGYLAVGVTLPSPTTDTLKIFAVKVDNSGNDVFVKTYKFNDLGGVGLKVLKSNSLYTILTNAWITKIDINGNQIQSVLIQLDTLENAVDMQIYNNNQYLFVTNKSNNSSLKICDTNGQVIKNKMITSPEKLRLKTSILLLNQNILVFGNAKYDTSIAYNYYAIRTDSNLYIPPIGINTIVNINPKNFRLYQNYPNPFNNSTIFKFDIDKNGKYKLEIFTLLGQNIDIVFDKFFQAGNYTVNYSNNKISSGIYIFKLSDQTNSLAKKFILIK